MFVFFFFLKSKEKETYHKHSKWWRRRRLIRKKLRWWLEWGYVFIVVKRPLIHQHIELVHVSNLILTLLRQILLHMLILSNPIIVLLNQIVELILHHLHIWIKSTSFRLNRRLYNWYLMRRLLRKSTL